MCTAVSEGIQGYLSSVRIVFSNLCICGWSNLGLYIDTVLQKTWIWLSYTFLSFKCVLCVLVCCAFTEVMFDGTRECDRHIPSFPWSVSYAYWFVVHSQRLCLTEHVNVIVIYLPFLEVCRMRSGLLCIHRGYVWQNTWMWSSCTFLSLKCVLCVLVCCAFTEVMFDGTRECDRHVPSFPWSVSYAYWFVVHSQRFCLTEHVNVIIIYLPFLEVCRMRSGLLCIHRGYDWCMQYPVTGGLLYSNIVFTDPGPKPGVRRNQLGSSNRCCLAWWKDEGSRRTFALAWLVARKGNGRASEYRQSKVGFWGVYHIYSHIPGFLFL